MRWLDAGGLQSNSDDVIPFDAEPVKPANVGSFDPQAKSVSADAFEPNSKPETDFAFDSKTKSENVFVFEPHPKDKNILAFKRPKSASVGAFAPPRDALGKQELYCFSLLELLIGFTSQVKDADVGDSLLADIQTSLEDLLDEVLRTNYAPELNAARYELYSSYWLDGGEV